MWDLLPIFWVPPRVLVSSLSLPFAAHTACLLGSGWLHYVPVLVLAGHPMMLTFPKSVGALMAISLFLALFGDSKPHPHSAKFQPLSRTAHAFKTSPT